MKDFNWKAFLEEYGLSTAEAVGIIALIIGAIWVVFTYFDSRKKPKETISYPINDKNLIEELIKNLLKQVENKDLTIRELEEKAQQQLEKSKEILASPEISDDIKDLVKLGKFEEALQLVNKRYKETDQKQAIELAKRLYEKAEIEELNLKYNEAEKSFQKASVLDDDNSVYLNAYGMILYKNGKYKEALPVFKSSLAIREKVLGKDHPDTATSYNNLAGLYRSMGEYQQALPLYQSSLTIRKKVLGKEHPDTAVSYNNLALLYQSMGEYQQALPLYQSSLAIREKVLGKEHPDTAVSYNNLAALYELMGEYQQALPLFQSSLAIREKVLGKEHPDTATSYNNLAVLYQSMGEYEQALPLFQSSLAIREKVLGKEHPDTAASYNNLAGLYFKQSEYQLAEECMLKAVNINKKALPENHPNALSSIKSLKAIQEKL